MSALKKPVFDPVKEIPSLAEKVILITGGTSGLGRETLLTFAAHKPAHLYFTGRSQPGADEVIKEAAAKFPKTPVTFIKCDLASLASVQNAAREFLAQESRLDILNANAGIMARPPGLTSDGYEIQFGTNHVGHALFVKLLTPLLTATAEKGNDVRVVWCTSLGHKMHPKGGIQFDKLKTKHEDIAHFMATWARYGQSKLANLLYARAYAKHNPSITSVSVHPGISNTGLYDGLAFSSKLLVYSTGYLMMIPAYMCAWNQQWASTAPLGSGKRQVENGAYYEPVGVKGGLTKISGSDELAEKLWNWTEKELEPWAI